MQSRRNDGKSVRPMSHFSSAAKPCGANPGHIGGLNLGEANLEATMSDLARNVLGGVLQPCSTNPMTGFFRTGDCQVTEEDVGNHGVCIVATAEFLAFSRSRGNDLSTPHPEFRFPGLKPGNRWCLCSVRWQEALQARVAPPVVLEATSSAALEVVSLNDLKRHAAHFDQAK